MVYTCIGFTKKGDACKRRVQSINTCCKIHKNQTYVSTNLSLDMLIKIFSYYFSGTDKYLYLNMRRIRDVPNLCSVSKSWMAACIVIITRSVPLFIGNYTHERLLCRVISGQVKIPHDMLTRKFLLIGFVETHVSILNENVDLGVSWNRFKEMRFVIMKNLLDNDEYEAVSFMADLMKRYLPKCDPFPLK